MAGSSNGTAQRRAGQAATLALGRRRAAHNWAGRATFAGRGVARPPRKYYPLRRFAAAFAAFSTSSWLPPISGPRCWRGCVFFWLRKYLLNELTGYHFTEGQLFDLTGSALFIAMFWTAALRAGGRVPRHLPQVAPGRNHPAGAGVHAGRGGYLLHPAARRPGRGELPRLLQNVYGLLPAAFLHLGHAAHLGREQRAAPDSQAAAFLSPPCWWAPMRWP